MKVKELLNVLGSGENLVIGTVKGRGWLYQNKTIHLDTDLPEWVKERKVFNMYSIEGREGSQYACEIKSGIAVIIEGTEGGII